MKNVVEFKSIEPYYRKEKDGLKPNTVRHVDMKDERFVLLKKWSQLSLMNLCLQRPQIALTLVDKRGIEKETIIRDITDVTFWEDLCIISWEDKR